MVRLPGPFEGAGGAERGGGLFEGEEGVGGPGLVGGGGEPARRQHDEGPVAAQGSGALEDLAGELLGWRRQAGGAEAHGQRGEAALVVFLGMKPCRGELDPAGQHAGRGQQPAQAGVGRHRSADRAGEGEDLGEAEDVGDEHHEEHEQDRADDAAGLARLGYGFSADHRGLGGLDETHVGGADNEQGGKGLLEAHDCCSLFKVEPRWSHRGGPSSRTKL